MSKRIGEHQPVLLGVSFGGILVQEIAQCIKVKKVIIVSSVNQKSFNNELSKTNAHKLLPLHWVENIEALAYLPLGKPLREVITL